MFITPGSRRFTATVFCVLAQASKTKCTKEDDKKPTDFTAFLNKVGDSKGDVFEKLKEAAKGINGNNEIDFGSMLDSKNVRKVFENGIPGQIGYGFMMGFCSGFCVKKVSKIIAFGVGGVFITLQALSYNGLININYEKVQKSVEREMDLNHDGKLGADDLMLAYDKLQTILGHQMPAGGGFAAGFLMGART